MRRGAIRVLLTVLAALAAILIPLQATRSSPGTRLAVVRLQAPVRAAAQGAPSLFGPRKPPPEASDAASSGSPEGDGSGGGATTAGAAPRLLRARLPFSVSHLGLRWRGTEDVVAEVRLGRTGSGYGPWRMAAVNHDVSEEETGDFRSGLLLASGATEIEARVTGVAEDLEVVAIDAYGAGRQQLSGGYPQASAVEASPADPDPSEDPSHSEDQGESSAESTSDEPATDAPATEDPSGAPEPAESPSPDQPTEADQGVPAAGPSASSTSTTTEPEPTSEGQAEEPTPTTAPSTNPGPSTTTTTEPRSKKAEAPKASSTTAPPTTTGASQPAPVPVEGRVPDPTIATRASWGADESKRREGPEFAPVRKLLVHHTVTPNDDPDPAATVRAIYAYHTEANGWNDIAYHFLIDSKGQVYEGRFARTYRTGEVPNGENENGQGVIGAHARDANTGTMGVALLGNFVDAAPSAAALRSLEQILAWKAQRHGIEVMEAEPYVGVDGRTRTFPNISGHRDVGSTECPGGRLYDALPGLRSRVDELVAASESATLGYWTATRDGQVHAFGNAESYGSLRETTLNAPVLGMAVTPSGGGYWLVASDGGVFALGDARFFGSTGSMKLNSPIVGMTPTPTGKGYWLVASDGGVFSYGDAVFHGSTGSMKLNRPVVGMAATSTGKGYWLVASDGGVFSYGDAVFHGSTGSLRLNSPIVSLARGVAGDAGDRGYWLLARDGGVFAFSVPFHGSVPGLAQKSYAGAVALRPTSGGRGYYVASEDGTINTFGHARFHGSKTGLKAGGVAVDLALRP